MLVRHFVGSVCLVVLGVPLCFASTDPVFPVPASDPAANPAVHAAATTESADYSSSVSNVSSGAAGAESAAAGAGDRPKMPGIAPFSAVAIQVKAGIAGAGLDVAVPLANRFNLRAGGSFFSYNPNLVVDGIGVNGSIQLRSGSASVDIFPFGNAFRISPGVVFYNGNQISAVASVPSGNTFTLNSVQYYSSSTAPVTGTFGLSFGNKVAPSLTLGFGNMIPRKGGHWSVPFEIGGEYIGTAPQISLRLTGTTCQGTATTNCSSIASNTMTQQNIVAEQASLNSNIPQDLKFFPIISIGLSYKFGHGGGR